MWIQIQKQLQLQIQIQIRMICVYSYIFLADCAFACDEELVKCLQPPYNHAPSTHSPHFRTIVTPFFLFPNEMQLENVKEKGQTVAAKGKLQ